MLARTASFAASLAPLAALFLLSAEASAQGYGAPPQQYGPSYGTPSYGAPAYGQGYGYGPQQGPPAPPPPPRATCCTWSARANPFDLIFRRATLEGEVKIWGPFTAQIAPTLIWGSPAENVDASGFALAAQFGGYFSGHAFKGWWLKGYAGFETFDATVTVPDDGSGTGSASDTISSPVFGGMIGSTSVFGRNGGFVISGGLGIGVATAEKQSIVACTPGRDGSLATPDDGSCFQADWYDKTGKIQLLGSFSLGVAF